MFILLTIIAIASFIATCYYITIIYKDAQNVENLQAQIEEHEETIVLLESQLFAKNKRPKPVFDEDDEILDYTPTEEERNEHVS